jgi:hypothetical protein
MKPRRGVGIYMHVVAIPASDVTDRQFAPAIQNVAQLCKIEFQCRRKVKGQNFWYLGSPKTPVYKSYRFAFIIPSYLNRKFIIAGGASCTPTYQAATSQTAPNMIRDPSPDSMLNIKIAFKADSISNCVSVGINI